MYDNTYKGHTSENILSGLKESFRHGSPLIRLIYINLGIFLMLKLFDVVLLLGGNLNFYDTLLEYLGVPADLEYLLYRPWTLFTYMFTQYEFLHLLFNMLWLYWFGTFFLDHFSGKQLTGVYLLGGLSGALLYLLAYNTLPFFETSRLVSWTIGASASVMAIVFAVCIYLPNQRVYIFLIGPVKLIYLALFTAIVDILSIPSGNAGGHIAHLGGAFFGYLFVLGIRRNYDITRIITSFPEMVKQWFAPRPKMRVSYRKTVTRMTDKEYNEYKRARNQKVDEILDKISHSGYESLSKEEKELLFKIGKREENTNK